MAHQSNFQRSSPLRTPVRLGKLNPVQHKLKKSTDIPPLATQFLRSLNNDRRSSFKARISVGRTVQQDACHLDHSCMDQFDDSFAPELDARMPLTPRKSPHLKRRNSLTHLNKKLKPSKPSSSVGATGASALAGVGGVVTSRKKISGMRKRLMNTVRKALPGRRSGYSQL